ncbi:hypothetical protein [Acetivibrio cellulolyticus]|uniref:hypothetical protein n=1 Tax=Acetivibrio cellulolyticus TaxID=35830 RepID=UPI0001E2D555|nr:hypothetical protein [Acetivibrio cellulolyticus]
MGKTKKKISIKGQYITVRFNSRIKLLIMKEIETFVEVLKFVYEVTSDNDVFGDAVTAEDLFYRLLVTTSEKVEMPLREFYILLGTVKNNSFCFSDMNLYNEKDLIAFEKFKKRLENVFKMIK